jgi:hypothetical protein
LPATAKPKASTRKDSIVCGEIASSKASDIGLSAFLKPIAEPAARRYDSIKKG